MSRLGETRTLRRGPGQSLRVDLAPSDAILLERALDEYAQQEHRRAVAARAAGAGESVNAQGARLRRDWANEFRADLLEMRR